MNKWGIAGIVSLVAVIPASEALAAVVGGRTRASNVPGFLFALVALVCGVVAARRGRRSWLVVSVVAAGLAVLAVLGMIGE